MLRRAWMAGVLGVLMLAAAAPALAQGSGRIDGRLTNMSGRALGGVAVVLSGNGEERAALTDGTGAFNFSGVPAGAYTLTYTLGDSSDTGEVTVVAGATAEVAPQLDWDTSFAESITVYSASRRTERITEAPAAITVIPQEEIERQATSGQVPKLLEFTPGAEVTQSGLYDFNFNTRGFNSSLNRRVLTLIDGRDPSVPFLGSQEWAAVSFPLDDLASVELVRGPGSALYGADAFNGVLNMVTKSPRYSEGGKVQLTGGDLDTRRIDVRVAGEIGGDAYFKVTGGYMESDDFAVSRNPASGGPEYLPCPPGADTGCLTPEPVPLAVDRGQARLRRPALRQVLRRRRLGADRRGRHGADRGAGGADRHRPRAAPRRRAAVGARQLQHRALERPRLLQQARRLRPARPALRRHAGARLGQHQLRDPGQHQLRRRPRSPDRRRLLQGGEHRLGQRPGLPDADVRAAERGLRGPLRPGRLRPHRQPARGGGAALGRLEPARVAALAARLAGVGGEPEPHLPPDLRAGVPDAELLRVLPAGASGGAAQPRRDRAGAGAVPRRRPAGVLEHAVAGGRQPGPRRRGDHQLRGGLHRRLRAQDLRDRRLLQERDRQLHHRPHRAHSAGARRQHQPDLRPLSRRRP